MALPKGKKGLTLEALSDKKWHCRECLNAKVMSGQIAGSGGIKGLKNDGYKIQTDRQECDDCKELRKCDRWTGNRADVIAHASIPSTLQTKILEHYNHIDAIEGRKRNKHELVIDHRFPKIRWATKEPPNKDTMTPDEIQSKFQLLKKDRSGDHNQLKSRACESCKKTGTRGSPLGIKFYYKGSEQWPENVPVSGDEAGCVGCGWYDFNRWRAKLNKKLHQ